MKSSQKRSPEFSSLSVFQSSSTPVGQNQRNFSSAENLSKKKPFNLLFSIDQFFFEYSKKTYQQRKTGEFFQQLKERKKLSIFYGNLSRKEILSVFKKAEKLKGYFSKNVFSLLECRLDVVLYRTGLTKTLLTARQMIKHKKIYVNGNLVNIPSFQLNPGDLVSLEKITVKKLNDSLLTSFKAMGFENFNQHTDFLRDSRDFLQSPLLENRLLTEVSKSKRFCQLLIFLVCAQLKTRFFLKNHFTRHFKEEFIDFLSFFELKSSTKIQEDKRDKTIGRNLKNSLPSSSLNHRNSLNKILKAFRIFFLFLNNSSRFSNLVTLYLQQKQISSSSFLNLLAFRRVKPLNVEISYKLCKIIYLYSPQRLNFPFSIDLDVIRRSFR